MLFWSRLQIICFVRSNVKMLRMVSSTLSRQFHCSSCVSNVKRIQMFKGTSLPDHKNGTYVSQYYPPSQVQSAEIKIREYLSENSPETFDEWEEAKNNFYTDIPIISDLNYSSVVMNVLLTMNKINLAQSFMKHLRERNHQPNILSYLQYIAICGRNVEHCGQEEILKSFEKIKHFIDSNPVFDMKSGSYIIQGLCGTDKWRTAFDYLKKIPYVPSVEIRNNLAFAAIKNNDEALAWEIVSKRFRKGEVLGHRVIEEFLKYANKLLLKDRRKAESFLLKLFYHMEENNIVFNENAAKLVEAFFKSHSSNWKTTYTKVNRTGECEVCRKTLKYSELSDREFTVLRNAFLDKSVKKTDIFINTTAEEFKKYIYFIEKHKPFHIVIDGLNVAYTVQKQKSPWNLAVHLLKAVERMSSKSRKVLVLGRKHMVGWPQGIMRKISNLSSVFLANNSSQDDPFIVYAALASGPNTYVLTMDLMRDHIARLDDSNLIMLFKKWQQSHQVLLKVDESNNLKFTEPVRHSINIQGNMDSGWHIPYDDEIDLEPYEELNNWLCIQKM